MIFRKAKNKIKVLVAMSGGVDSSVAAALLVKAGYNVTGAFMVNYDGQTPNGQSCWLGDYRDALRVASHLGIPMLRWDFVKEYNRDVLDYMFKEYNLGRTPNPDILCNKFVKFGAWLDRAKVEGFDYLATGHYGSVSLLSLRKSKAKQYKLLEAKDKNKDQTYFLHQLNQEQLTHTLFPIGNYTKPQVRKLASKFKLPTAEKDESMGICFIGEVPMKEFLQQRIKPSPGNVVLTDGKIIGTHDGLPFYTIGQRHFGGKGGNTEALFVVAKNKDKNELVVGGENDPLLYSKEIQVGETNWISGEQPKFPFKCQVRLRHRQAMQGCVLEKSDNDKIVVKFDKPERAVTPGQFAVFYKKGVCLGGGVIL